MQAWSVGWWCGGLLFQAVSFQPLDRQFNQLLIGKLGKDGAVGFDGESLVRPRGLLRGGGGCERLVLEAYAHILKAGVVVAAV
jgi:hypothetical protein